MPAYSGTGGAWWIRQAAYVVSVSPLAATDWEAHDWAVRQSMNEPPEPEPESLPEATAPATQLELF